MEKTLSLFRLTGLWIHGRIFRNRTAKWDHQYASGRWEKLKTTAEHGRFDATARLLARNGPAGRVLEIGCGEALQQQRTDPGCYHSWEGIDISEIAIERAQAFASDRVRYHVADMETFEPDGRFDVIVFTESIYYSNDSRRLLERYVRFLKPTGCFIVSICRTRKRSALTWAGLHTIANPIDALVTTNELGTWECEVMLPRETPAAEPRSDSASPKAREETPALYLAGLLACLTQASAPKGHKDESGFHPEADPSALL